MNHSLEILVFSFTTVSMQRTGLNEKNNFEVTTVGWILSFVWISFFPLQKRARITFPYVARVLWRQIHIKIMRLPLEYLHWMLGPKGHMKYQHSIFSISLSSSHCAAQHVLFDNLTTLNRCFLFALPTQVLFYFFYSGLLKVDLCVPCSERVTFLSVARGVLQPRAFIFWTIVRSHLECQLLFTNSQIKL